MEPQIQGHMVSAREGLGDKVRWSELETRLVKRSEAIASLIRRLSLEKRGPPQSPPAVGAEGRAATGAWGLGWDSGFISGALTDGKDSSLTVQRALSDQARV